MRPNVDAPAEDAELRKAEAHDGDGEYRRGVSSRRNCGRNLPQPPGKEWLSTLGVRFVQGDNGCRHSPALPEGQESEFRQGILCDRN